MNTEVTTKWMLIACLVAAVSVSSAAAAQDRDSTPAAAAEKPRDGKEKAPPQPGSARQSQKRDASREERPRVDVPVSFPVDI